MRFDAVIGRRREREENADHEVLGELQTCSMLLVTRELRTNRFIFELARTITYSLVLESK